MEKIITVNFKNIVSVLERNNMKLCFLKSRGMLIEDEQKNLYQMESSCFGSYLDKLIKNAVVVKFDLVNSLVSKRIEVWEKEIWDATEVKNFIKRQSL